MDLGVAQRLMKPCENSWIGHDRTCGVLILRRFSDDHEISGVVALLRLRGWVHLGEEAES